MTKRLIFIDFIRGIMIFYMIILHAFLYRVVHQYKPLFEDIMTTSPLIVRIIAAPFIFFSLWGSFFCMLAGIVYIYRVREDFNSANFQAEKYFLKRGLSGIILIIIQYIWLTFFSPKSTEHPGPSTYSLITGSIERLEFSGLSALHYSTTGMIESLGWIIVALSFLGYFVYRRRKNINLKFYVYFGISFFISILISILLEIWIKDPTIFYDELYSNKKIFQLIIMLKLTSNRFSFFPLITFGLSGAFIGFNISNNQKDIRMLIILFSTGLFSILGYIFIYLQGFDMMGAYTSSYVPYPLHLLNFGGQCIFIGSFYLLFQKYQNTERERDIGIVRFLQLYNSTSLTVYFLESFTSILIFLVVQGLYFKPISEEFFVWTGFLVINALAWYGILVLWRKKDYKYSIEWLLGKLKRKLNASVKFSQ
jgi:hypothetical protein